MIDVEITRKEEILNVAARLFRAKGYSATSMRDLAGEVGMEAASLYNHIKNKEELLAIICESVAQKHVENLSIVDQQTSAIERIEKLLRLHIQVSVHWPDMTAVAEEEWRHLPDEYRADFRNKRKQYEAELKRLIVEAIEKGEVRANDPTVTLYTVLSSLHWLHHWYRQERPISEDEIINQMLDITLNGIRK